MKLYTEEELMNYLKNHYDIITTYDLQNIPHIELPSDEEIEESAVKIYGDFGGCSVSVERGAKWMRDKIQGQ